MIINISNVIEIKPEEKDDMTNIWNYCDDKLVVGNPEYANAVKMGRYFRNIPEKLFLYEKKGDVIQLPFGCLTDIWSYIKNEMITINFNHHKNFKLKGGINLYDYQKNAVNALFQRKNGILKAPCGSGKTIIGLMLVQKIGLRTLWLTHTKDLLNQSLASCKNLFPECDYGTITDGKVDIGANITFATVQTMCKLDKEIYQDEFDVVIVDECHRCSGSPTKMKQFYKVVNNIKARYKYGLSATIHRNDGLIQSTYSILGNIIFEISEQDVKDKRIKASIKMLELDTPKSEEYLKFDGTMDFNALINYLCQNKRRNETIINCLVNSKDRYNLVLTHRVNHAEELCRMLGCGSVVTGKTKNREEIFEKVKEGKEHFIFSTYALAKEGLDLPILDRLHLVTPQKDFAIVKQSVGRVERKYEGKNNADVVDYIDKNIGYCVNSFKKRKKIYKGGK